MKPQDWHQLTTKQRAARSAEIRKLDKRGQISLAEYKRTHPEPEAQALTRRELCAIVYRQKLERQLRGLKPRPLRSVTPYQVERLQAGDELLKRAIACLREAGAVRAVAAVQRARKSVDGARRHAERCTMPRN